jgi:phosphoglycerate dehydrogenase-like enzyme
MRTLITVSKPELKKVLFSEDSIRLLQSFSDVDWVEENVKLTSEELAGMIGGYDACITSWGTPRFTRDVLEKANKLTFIGHAAGTVVPLLDEYVFELPIQVVSANAPLAKTTAEGVIAMMLTGSWKLWEYNNNLKRGYFSTNYETVMGLSGQTVGIIGFGEVAREVIRLIKPFEPRILVYDKYVDPQVIESFGAEPSGLEELLRASGIVSLHCALTPETAGLVGREQLSMMRDGSLLLNTARGPVVDEEALLAELRSERIYAVLDVYNQEPLPMNHELLQLSHAFCLPHVGAYQRYWKSRFGLYVIEQLNKIVAGEIPQGVITRTRFQGMTRKLDDYPTQGR